MAGILNKKTRFVDLVVTQEGKRQMASGKLRAEYASLSDASVAYEDSMTAADVRTKIYFQTMEKPENVIVLEKDDSGQLIDYDFSPKQSIVGDNIFSKEGSTKNLHALKLATGSQFTSLSEELPSSFLRHFKNHQIVGTKIDNENNEFEVDKEQLYFAISNTVPFPNGPKKETINVNQAESFLFDAKLTHLDNFLYLPPENVDGTSYGVYQDLRNMTRETWEDIKKDLGFKHFEEIENFKNENNDMRIDKSGDYKVFNRKKLLPTSIDLLKQYNVVNFEKTSNDNNLLMQIFESDPGRAKLKKLDIINAGVFYEEDDVNKRYEKQVFYAGKIYFDDYNSPTFINIFTIIMD